jgi:aspartate aminotransferase
MNPIRRDILDLQQNGIATVAYEGLGQPDVIPLWFGESDMVTPAFIREAAKRALDDGKTFYVHARGIRELREAIQAYHRRAVGAEIPFERITVPGAATLGVIMALQCLIQTGDNIVVVSPIWPFIFQAARVAGAEQRFVRLDPDWKGERPRWHLDLDKLFDACDLRTKAIFVASPGNPTGWVASRDEQKAILEFARRRGIAVISDEVYGSLVYDGARHTPSFLEIAGDDDPVFVINTFSKAWAMTGWRIGWLVHPKSLDTAMQVMAVANNTGATTFAQYGGLAALSPEGDGFRAQMLERCREGRDVLQRFIDKQNHIRWMKPEGAFYGFLHIDGLKDSLSFALDLVRKHRVGVAPGSAFGDGGDIVTESFIRVCFAQDAARLSTGLERIALALAR